MVLVLPTIQRHVLCVCVCVLRSLVSDELVSKNSHKNK